MSVPFGGSSFVCLWLAASLSPARWAIPSSMPVERVLKNLTASLAESPDDPSLLLNAGRTHMMAYTFRTDRVVARARKREDDTTYEVMGSSEQAKYTRVPGRGGVYPNPEVQFQHLASALRLLGRAHQIDPNNAIITLSLSNAIESGAHLADRIDLSPILSTESKGSLSSTDEPLVLERLMYLAEGSIGKNRVDVDLWVRSVLDSAHWFTADSRPRIQRVASSSLVKAWRLASLLLYCDVLTQCKDRDMARSSLPLAPSRDLALEAILSYEAATRILVICKDPDVVGSEVEWATETARQVISRIEQLPSSRLVSPIIVSMSGSQTIEELVAGGPDTCFDISSNGRPGVRSWPRPSTPLLVWQPSEECVVDSGRQLFGNWTWGLVHVDGFSALSLLDDNRDGWLDKSEWEGVRLWYDLDGNGVLAKNEVRDLEECGVAAIECRWRDSTPTGLWNREGVRLTNGESRPIVDWYVQGL